MKNEERIAKLRGLSRSSCETGSAIQRFGKIENICKRERQYLIEKAPEQCGFLAVFVVQEDLSDFRFLEVPVFAYEIAPCLHITKRFVGEEPFDPVTGSITRLCGGFCLNAALNLWRFRVCRLMRSRQHVRRPAAAGRREI